MKKFSLCENMFPPISYLPMICEVTFEESSKGLICLDPNILAALVNAACMFWGRSLAASSRFQVEAGEQQPGPSQRLHESQCHCVCADDLFRDGSRD